MLLHQAGNDLAPASALMGLSANLTTNWQHRGLGLALGWWSLDSHIWWDTGVIPEIKINLDRNDRTCQTKMEKEG